MIALWIARPDTFTSAFIAAQRKKRDWNVVARARRSQSDDDCINSVSLLVEYGYKIKLGTQSSRENEIGRIIA